MPEHNNHVIIPMPSWAWDMRGRIDEMVLERLNDKEHDWSLSAVSYPRLRKPLVWDMITTESLRRDHDDPR